MKLVEMPDLTTTITFKGMSAILFIPGGWSVAVPTVTPDNDSLSQITHKYTSEGMEWNQARQRALTIIQRTFEEGWLRGLKAAVRRWAKEYADRWPELVEGSLSDDPGLTLAGFDPEELAPWYAPQDNPGKAGKPGRHKEMERMAQDALDSFDTSSESES